MKVLAVHTSDDGDSHLAVTFECESWEQAEEMCERHGLALQGAKEEASNDEEAA